MSADIWLVYGANLQFDSRGDLAIATDTPTSPDATNQRLLRLMLTRCRKLLSSLGYYSMPDDVFNPDWGIGLGTYTHQNIINNKLGFETKLLSEVAQDPGVSPTPPPTLTYSNSDGAYYALLSWTGANGQRYTVPPVLLATGG